MGLTRREQPNHATSPVFCPWKIRSNKKNTHTVKQVTYLFTTLHLRCLVFSYGDSDSVESLLAKNYPDTLCREYLPTFPLESVNLLPILGKYTIYSGHLGYISSNHDAWAITKELGPPIEEVSGIHTKFQRSFKYMGVSKNRGTPNMDGEINGKPY